LGGKKRFIPFIHIDDKPLLHDKLLPVSTFKLLFLLHVTINYD